MANERNGGLLRVVPLAEYEAQVAEEDRAKFVAQRDAEAESNRQLDNLASHIRTKWEQMRRHRNSAAGWSDRLMMALRSFNGEYSPEKLAQIKKFGGSEVYARVIAMKCRGASSLLRDIYLTPDRPWAITPPADPDIPEDIAQRIQMLVETELQSIQAQGGGGQITPTMIRDRVNQLMEAARQAEKKQARQRATIAQDRIDEILETGGFYKALAEFLVDIPLFPFAALKGPVVKVMPTVKWENGQPITAMSPRMCWSRISPFDLWWTPGASDVEDAEVIERQRITRTDLNDLLDLPGYNQENIRAALREYGRGGYNETPDGGESERADYENRENPNTNTSGMFTCLEFHGNIQGSMLQEYGFKEGIEDPDRDYMVQAWIVGRYVIKAQFSPSPRKRHPYFISSFEKVPGTPVGNGLPDILSDIQEVSNATLRALVNNMSIASGPQVVVRDDMVSPGADGDELYPWKRWHVQSDMGVAGQTLKPIDFFQPNSNAQELLGVYSRLGEIADELSAIPRHMSGANPGSGAGRTASGLAMLMGNASKILQTVAANIDRDVMEPALTMLYDMIMLTDTTGILHGDENIRVMGVNVAMQRETQRVRQLEFLQITANPLDAQIVGAMGRAKVLRSVASEIGLDGEAIVPPDDELAARERQQQEMMAAAAQAQGGQGPAPGGSDGPQTNVT